MEISIFIFSYVIALITSNTVSRGDENLMVWHEAKDPRALCNDYSRAGFFLRRNSSSHHWIIFLESGSLCFSSDTCNRRFFRNESRPHMESAFTLNEPFGDFDPVALFDSLRDSPYQDYVNPSMTSMKCLRKSLFYTTEGGTIAVKGRDILSPVKNENEDFYSHNHVLIPYCSSDLWLLGSDLDNSSDMENTNCNIFSGYSPGSTDLQFAFRGQVIFRSIFEQLMQEHNMSSASSILLSGSSAGGLGAINQAQWVKENIPLSTELKLLIDSAWFVNFQGNIEKLFEETTQNAFTESFNASSRERLINMLYTNKACMDIVFGYPCCFSSQCMLTRRNASGDLAYFPESNVKMFFISSRYDVFILAPSLIGRDDLSSSSKENATAVLFNFLTYAGEYGGEMTNSIHHTYSVVPTFSYYLTQCYQHIYLATSTLWEDNVFNTDITHSAELVAFRHMLKPGHWNLPLAGNVSIREAIHQWYESDNYSQQFDFRDGCDGPYCNEQCPETFKLGILGPTWPLALKVVIAAAVVIIGFTCVFLKCCFKIWLLWLENKQNKYLESLDNNLEEGSSHLAFPACGEEDAMSVSCLDLNYTIWYKASEKIKDERLDKTEATVLKDIEEQNSRASFSNSNRPTCALQRRKKFLGFKSGKSELSGIDIQQPCLEPQSEPTLDKTDAEQKCTAESLCGLKRKVKKHILKNISIYFNPGEMIGIMGPSGCGKTTFMDLLTGRRRTGTQEGAIYVNGTPMQEVLDWYTANTGYVLQLARPYYEELSVRENLTLAAEIKLPVSKFTTKDKFMRVEQVMDVTVLTRLAETVVGGETGPGLSGGQKRRLSVALQLLRLPSVLFLDEPTSGLDATSSMELLSHLNKLSDSNRTVILTIHQPRLEIFHMFHKLVLLSDGKVAYNGAPEKAYEVFVSALRVQCLKQGQEIPSLEDHNPADVIMDMLGNPSFRCILTEYYHKSNEPKFVRCAINTARLQKHEQTNASNESITSEVGLSIFGERKVTNHHANLFVRLAALEARAVKRLSTFQISYLPIIFFAFGLILGTVYFQKRSAFLVISGMCVFSVASGIFVFPAIEPYYLPAIRVYSYERADGIGRSQDLVLQGFIRYVSVAIIPVIGSTALAYFLLVNREAYDALVFLQVILVNLCLNFTWTALLIALLVAVPRIAFRLSSAIASVAGFTSGFFIPIKKINWAYRWLAYINPNYYGLSSVAFLILEDYNLCTGNQLTCYFQSGAFTLRSFFYDEVNPYLHIMILLGFTLFFLGLGIFANWLRYTSSWSKIKRKINIAIFKKSGAVLAEQIKTDRQDFEMRPSMDNLLQQVEENKSQEKTFYVSTAFNTINEIEDDTETVPEPNKTHHYNRKNSFSTHSWHLVTSHTPSKKSQPMKRRNTVSNIELDMSSETSGRCSPFVMEEKHFVWLPRQNSNGTTKAANFSGHSLLNSTEDNNNDSFQSTNLKRSSHLVSSSHHLNRRRKTLIDRVNATQAILKDMDDDLLREEMKGVTRHMTLLDASLRLLAKQHHKNTTES